MERVGVRQLGKQSDYLISKSSFKWQLCIIKK